MSAALAPRTVHVEHCMGTVFSLDIRDEGNWDAAIADVVRWLHHVDAVFSTYRPDSEISRLDRGELTDPSPLVREVLDACAELTRVSDGSFSARPSGRLDPSGYVKGWAIQRASGLLRAAGSENHTVNGGGDVQATGSRSPGEPWRVGVTHPLRPGMLAAVVRTRGGAVATSGTAERGAHIVDPHTGAAVTELASVTVVGPELRLADAYATAAFAMGGECRSWLTALPDYEALVVTARGTLWRTPGFAAWTA